MAGPTTVAVDAQLMSVGWSDAQDAEPAIAEAMAMAMRGRSCAAGDLVLVMADIQYARDDLMAAATARGAPAQVIGCSSTAAFATLSDVPHRCVVLHLPADRLAIGVGSSPDGHQDLTAAARDASLRAKTAASAVTAADGVARPHAALLLIAGGLSGDLREVVRGAYEIAGAGVPLVGGAAGEDWSLSGTWQADGTAIYDHGVVAVWLASPDPLGIGIDHGYEPVSRQMQVTRGAGDVIQELDGRPALEVYLEARGGLGRTDADNFLGQALDRPLGLPTADGTYEVRVILSTSEDGLVLNGHVHDQAVVRVLAADEPRLHAGARRAVTTATAVLGREPRAVLVFSCAIRHAILGQRIGNEIATIADALDGAPAAGFYTYGEFARDYGATGFHNASVSVLAL